MKRSRRTLVTKAGNQIVANKFMPTREPIAVIVIAPAMAVQQSFYAAFAEYLANYGYTVWTFDYSGIGDSWSGLLRRCKADISEWVSDNYDLVVRIAARENQGLPVFIVGHSLGGQTAPLLPSAHKLSGLMNIAVGSGSTLHLQPNVRRLSPLLWHFAAPVLCTTFGYFPGKLINLIGNVPRRAFMQWRRWCLTPEYLLTGERGGRDAYARAFFPVLGLTFSDDEMLTSDGSKIMHEAFRNAPVEYRVIDPNEFGISKIGHFGFFKPSNGADLWPLATKWIDSHTDAKSKQSKTTQSGGIQPYTYILNPLSTEGFNQNKT